MVAYRSDMIRPMSETTIGDRGRPGATPGVRSRPTGIATVRRDVLLTEPTAARIKEGARVARLSMSQYTEALILAGLAAEEARQAREERKRYQAEQRRQRTKEAAAQA